MSTETLTSRVKADVESSLPTIWAVALICALIGAIPVALAREVAPYSIAFPILTGAAFAVLAELVRRRRYSANGIENKHVETFGPEFDNFSHLKEVAVVELMVRDGGKKQVSDAQMDLGFAYDISRPQAEKFRLFRTPDGRQLIALDCDRFSAMLTAETLESFDRSFDKSLEMTALRFSSSSVSKESMYLITNESAKDILKADIRGNLVTYLAKTNDHLFKKAIDELRKVSEKKSASTSGRRVGTRSVKS